METFLLQFAGWFRDPVPDEMTDPPLTILHVTLPCGYAPEPDDSSVALTLNSSGLAFPETARDQ